MDDSRDDTRAQITVRTKTEFDETFSSDIVKNIFIRFVNIKNWIGKIDVYCRRSELSSERRRIDSSSTRTIIKYVRFKCIRRLLCKEDANLASREERPSIYLEIRWEGTTRMNRLRIKLQNRFTPCFFKKNKKKPVYFYKP